MGFSAGRFLSRHWPNRLTSAADPNVSGRRRSPTRTYAIAIPVAVPEASATPAGDMTANMHATAASVTTTVASSVTTTVASSVTTATVSAMCLGRHVGCGHQQTSSAGSRKAIHSGQGAKGQ